MSGVEGMKVGAGVGGGRWYIEGLGKLVRFLKDLFMLGNLET